MSSAAEKTAYFAQYESFSAVQKHYGASYYVATKLLPKEQRDATYVLYTWFRVPDEIVDNSHEFGESAEKMLEYWNKAWLEAYKTNESVYPVLEETAKIFKRYEIPLEYAEAFFQAMRQDLTKQRYETYAELEQYMYGSAGVVGLILAQVLGCTEEGKAGALQLGYAMQLTNFLRDVEEDYIDRNRIYLPQADLQKYGVTEQMIADKNSESLKPVIKKYIQKTDQLYVQGKASVRYLKTGRLGVMTAAFLYEGIGKKIAGNNYNVFNKRHTTSSSEKVQLCLQAIWNLK